MRLIGRAQLGSHPTLALAEVPGPLPKFAGLATNAISTNSVAPLQSQSTSSSFMLHQPSSIIPQNTATNNTQPQDPIGPISSADYQRFGLLFIKTVGSAQGELTGPRAKDIFLKAKLPTATLGQIWNLVDKDNLGKLDLKSFVIAMHLIHGVLSGKISQLPPFLPESVWDISNGVAGNSNSNSSGSQTGTVSQQTVPAPAAGPLRTPTDQSFRLAPPGVTGGASASPISSPNHRQSSYSSINSQQTTVRHPNSPSREPSSGSAAQSSWSISPTAKSQYEHIFDNLDKSKSGTLSADQVASVLMSSKLNQEDLATVWDLSDIQNTGVFTKLEFTIALYLVNRRLAGEAFPNIVPAALIESIQSNQSVHNGAERSVSTASTQGFAPPHTVATSNTNAAASSPSSAPKSNLDDLVDIFGSAPPMPQPEPQLSKRQSSSDLTPVGTGDLPKVRKNLTGSFKPTSTFGQSLLLKHDEEPNLLGDDHTLDPTGAPAHAQSASTVSTDQPKPITASNEVSSSSGTSKSINYDALRSVPPPPSKQQREVSNTEFGSPQASSAPTGQNSYTRAPTGNYSAPIDNNDLLADTAVSGQLSQATSDIANVSNQIKSLSTQTTSLHDKKLRAEQELAKILATKREIDGKLKQLRSLYENEVKQVDQVEQNLVVAREETEALRSEASISEAKFNHLSTELNEKQVAMEDLQKQNSTLKEKLGFLNAEVVELETQLTQLTNENQRLNNQLSVKKSQVQVSIVKSEELKNKVSELTEENRQLSERYRKEEEEERKQAEEQRRYEEEIRVQEEHKRRIEEEKATREQKAKSDAAAAAAAAERSKPPPPASRRVSKEPPVASTHSENSSSVVPAAIVAGAGAVGAAVVGAIGLSHSEEKHSDEDVISKGHTKDIVPQANSVDVEPVADHVSNDLNSSTYTGGPSHALELRKSFDNPTNDGELHVETDTTTPLDDHAVQVDANVPGAFPTEVDKPLDSGDDLDNDEFSSSFPKLEQHPDSTTAPSTTSLTEFNDGETPVTSPNNSDFQFPQGTNAGIVGGMVGMPGVLVGVQRTDSLTSSVQNNAALSVRDDNIDEMSDRETLDVTEGTERTLPNSADNEISRSVKDEFASPPTHPEESDADKFSSGVESFEMVNAEEISPHEPPTYSETSKKATGNESGHILPNIDTEFPPIKEFDYDESDSSDDESQEKFDDAVDNLPNKPTVSAELPAPEVDFDSAFDDLEPTAQETKQPEQEDLFAGLQEAAPEDDVDEFAMSQKFDFDEEFTNQSNFADFASTVPDSSNVAASSSNGGDDEWEQLFAGFGNAGTSEPVATPAAPPVASQPATSSVLQSLIDELVGMGFDEKTAAEALNREGGDLEAATNYLLDNA